MDAPELREPMRLRPVGWVLAIILLYWLTLRFPVVRFSSHGFNTTVGLALFFGLPWALTITFFRVGRWWMTALGVLCALPLGLLTPLFMLGMMLVGSSDGYDPIQQLEWQGSTVRVYRGNGGATTNWSIGVRQERTILPGVLYVRPLLGLYPCYSLTIEPTARGVRVVDRSKMCEGPPIGTEIPLKRFLYF